MFYKEKYQNFINDNFFIIDSENCIDFEGKLYGYAILENKIIGFQKNYNQHINKSEYGTYINIIKEKNQLIIEQDFIGCYGLFLYQNEQYFALSNSFFYLVLHLTKNKKLTLNNKFIKYFMLEPLSSMSITDTAINEIKQIDKDTTIRIDTQNKTIHFTRERSPENIYDIDSKECFEILDKWFSKYCGLIHSLYNSGISTELSLSGGKDSRMILTLFYHLNLLSSINVCSGFGTTQRLKEDFAIASRIAEKFNFPLNAKPNNIQKIPFGPEQDLTLILLEELGIHKELYFLNHYNKEPAFIFFGLGGESLRNCWGSSQKEFINKRISKLEKKVNISPTYQAKILEESFTYLQQFPWPNIVTELYKQTWNKTHSGKSTALHTLQNTFIISPLQDHSLHLIKTNNNKYDDLLLTAIIYQRYMPGVIDIEFTNTGIDEAVKKHADLIQKKYPKHIEINTAYTLEFGERVVPEQENSSKSAQDLLSAFFETKEVKNFSRYFISDKIYSYSKELANTQNMHRKEANANTLCLLCILANVLLTNNLKLEEFLQQSSCTISNAKKQNILPIIIKLTAYQTFAKLIALPLLSKAVKPDFRTKLKRKIIKYHYNLLSALDNAPL